MGLTHTVVSTCQCGRQHAQRTGGLVTIFAKLDVSLGPWSTPHLRQNSPMRLVEWLRDTGAGSLVRLRWRDTGCQLMFVQIKQNASIQFFDSSEYPEWCRVPIGQQQWNFLTFYMPYQLNYGLIYQMAKYNRNMFPNFLAFLVADCETKQPYHNETIMTLAVKFWNEAYILISTPCFLTFSWSFGEFQDFLANITIYWVFPDLFRFSLFPAVWETCCICQLKKFR